MNTTPNARVLQSRENESCRRRNRLVAIASLLLNNAISEHAESFIVDPRTVRSPRFDHDIFMVTLHGYGRSFARIPSKMRILIWLRRAAHLLAREDVFVGGSCRSPDGPFHLEIIVAIRGRSRALNIGDACGQSSIYHPATNTVVHLRTQNAA